VGKMQFHHFCSSQGKSFWLLLEKSTVAPPGENPSDAHVPTALQALGWNNINTP